MRDPYFRHSGDGVKDAAWRDRASQRASSKRMRELSAWSKKMERERAQAERQAQREYIASQKESIRLKQASIIEDVAEKNRALSSHVESLTKLLEHTLTINDTISFETLKVKEDFAPFSPPTNLLRKKYPPDKKEFSISPLNWFTRLLPSAEARHEKKVKEADENYRKAVNQAEKEEATRKKELETLTKEYEDKKATFLSEAKAHNQEVENMQALYFKGDPDAIIYYNSLVLERSEYPDDFCQEINVTYAPSEKALHVEYKLPPLSIIPVLKELKYLKKSNELKEIQRKDTEINSLYKELIVAIALRSFHEIFEADQGLHLEIVEFEGTSELVDKASGRYMKVCVSASKEVFTKINLALIDKLTCFKELGGRLRCQ